MTAESSSPLISKFLAFILVFPGLTAVAQDPLQYVGRQVCAGCHQQQLNEWTGSHHDLSMLEIGDAASQASFAGQEVRHGGLLSRFITVDDVPVIEVEDSSGKQTLPVKYFFGVTPCQQVLVEGKRGRLQSYPVPWADSSAEGGARWYPLFPDETTPPGDPLHWSGILNNWNHMCAECHSTGLVKGYDPATDSFKTSWQELDVSCEACHGPGSQHVSWARQWNSLPQDERPEPPQQTGFPVKLHHEVASWVRAEGEKVARRDPPLKHHGETESCARCHSRRTALTDGSIPGSPLSDTHLLSLLEVGLYHDDGQILDEVYVHGSFLQSRMYSEGVTCSDCHDPHSGTLLLEGNALCIGCHDPGLYDLTAHHHHAESTSGSFCVDCHMPSRNYMTVDPRRDHSFRIPRPDLTIRIGTPNACNGCHQNQTPAWASEKVADWFPQGQSGNFHWGEALHAARTGAQIAPNLLRMALESDQTPGIARATALSELSRWLDASTLDLVDKNLDDPDPMIRRGALLALTLAPPEAIASRIFGFLSDSSLIVRLVTAELLAPLLRAPEAAEIHPALMSAISEYRKVQMINADRPEAHVNIGALETRLGNGEAALQAYRESLKREPSFGPASVNLADLLRALNRNEEGVQVLQEAITRVPDDAGLHHALGLALVRTGNKEQATASLARAVELAPESPRYALVHAVALHDSSRTQEAIAALEAALLIHPEDPDLQGALLEYKNRQADKKQD
ncbi:MAG: tetratricopeptide repeat protein [Planctomycetota bacterium]|nr:tetratricopeptide repeat protein [Planctomycetota bacterium]